MTSVQLSLLKYNEINQEDVTLARGEELFVYGVKEHWELLELLIS
jgi:hypothetical protein